MNNIIPYNQHDFEENIYDFYTCMLYKGALFTGTLQTTEDDGSYSIVTFREGNADGRENCYYPNGQLESECIYQNGDYISGKSWHANGQFHTDGIDMYDETGKQIKKNGSWLYPNGIKRNDSVYFETGNRYRPHYIQEYYEYDSSGNMAVKTIVDDGADYRNTVVYYDQVLSKCYGELLVNRYPKYDLDFRDLEHKIWGWAVSKYIRDEAEGLKLLKLLGKHENKNVVHTAMTILGKIGQNKFDAHQYLDDLSYHTKVEL